MPTGLSSRFKRQFSLSFLIPDLRVSAAVVVVPASTFWPHRILSSGCIDSTRACRAYVARTREDHGHPEETRPLAVVETRRPNHCAHRKWKHTAPLPCAEVDE